MLHHQYNFYKDLKVDNYKNALPIIGHNTTKEGCSGIVRFVISQKIHIYLSQHHINKLIDDVRLNTNGLI